MNSPIRTLVLFFCVGFSCKAQDVATEFQYPLAVVTAPDGAVYVADSLILPNGAQTGYVLTSDAGGNASWQPGGGGGSEWTDTGSLVHPAEIGDNVAIGGTNLGAPVHIDAASGDIRSNGSLLLGSGATETQYELKFFPLKVKK